MRYLKRLPERHSSLWLCSPDKFVQETHLRFFQNKITELVTTGRLGYYEDLKASIPAGLRSMLEIPGLERFQPLLHPGRREIVPEIR